MVDVARFLAAVAAVAGWAACVILAVCVPLAIRAVVR